MKRLGDRIRMGKEGLTDKMNMGSTCEMMIAGITVMKKIAKTRYCSEAAESSKFKKVRPTTREIEMWLKRRVKP